MWLQVAGHLACHVASCMKASLLTGCIPPAIQTNKKKTIRRKEKIGDKKKGEKQNKKTEKVREEACGSQKERRPRREKGKARRKEGKREKEKRKERRKKGKEEGNRNQRRAGSRTRRKRTRNWATRGRFTPTPVILRLGAT